VNRQRHLAGHGLPQTVSLASCDGDNFAVPSLLRVVHAEGTMLSVFPSIAWFQGDVRTLSCFVLKWTRSHGAPDAHLTNDSGRVFLGGCPKFS
jgi:hypothetical protein